MSNIAESIKTTTMEMISDLKENIFTSQEEQGDMMLVEFFFSKMPPKTIADHAVAHILPFSAQIAARNVEFFLKKKKEIFGGLPENRVNYFAHLIQTPEKNGGMSDENRSVVWDYFDTIKAFAEEYKKNK